MWFTDQYGILAFVRHVMYVEYFITFRNTMSDGRHSLVLTLYYRAALSGAAICSYTILIILMATPLLQLFTIITPHISIQWQIYSLNAK